MQLQTLKEITQNVTTELEKATKGEQTSFPFIKHRLSPQSLVKDDETFQIMVIGGSVFKKCLAKKKGARIILSERFQESQVPFPTKQSLLEYVARHLHANVSVLAINFAYPLTPIFEHGKLDGILFSGSKENTFEGLVGEKVCAEIEKYLYETMQRKIQISIANDTVNLLLSGLTKFNWRGLSAGIMGTGMNFAIFLDKETTVNLEAANFDKFPLSKTGKTIDDKSVAPGTSFLEKETAGAYLYRHFNLLLKEKNIDQSELASTKDLRNLLDQPESDAKQLAKELFEKSAQLLSCIIVGIANFYNTESVFIMEGSLIWDNMYNKIVRKTIIDLEPKFPIKLEEIAECHFFGPAKLVA